MRSRSGALIEWRHSSVAIESLPSEEALFFVQYGYRMAKSAAHMAATSMARDLMGRGVAVGIVHPGVVITDMTKKSGSNATVTAADSAAGILAQADALTLENTGFFRDYQGKTMPA